MNELIDIINTIYSQFFSLDDDNSINVFLCGKAIEDINSLRYKINKQISINPRLNVVFPEWIFQNITIQKKYDLLSLENILADCVDLIVIPLEGIGSLVELGSFTSNIKLIDRILVINYLKNKGKPSFINYGPVALIKNYNKDNIFYIENNDDKTALKKIVNRIQLTRRKTSSKDLNNLFDLSRFLFYFISIFQPITVKYLSILIHKWYNKNNKMLIDPALQILILKQLIRQKTFGKEDKIILSEKGHSYLHTTLKRLGISKKYYHLRTTSIYNIIRVRKLFNKEREKEKLLEKK